MGGFREALPKCLLSCIVQPRASHAGNDCFENTPGRLSVFSISPNLSGGLPPALLR